MIWSKLILDDAVSGESLMGSPKDGAEVSGGGGGGG